MDVKKMGRRTFLRLSAMAAAGAAVVACQPQTVIVKETVQVEKEVTKIVAGTPEKVVETKEVIKEVTKEVVKEKVVEVAGVSKRQAPALQELVKSGKLPPLEERLPVEPKTLSPSRNEVPAGDLDLTIGKYGGTIRTVQPDPAWQPDLFVMNDEPLCGAPGILAEDVAGNVVKSFEVEGGGKAFVFHMREGLKWSDGQPVTSEDVQFTYEDFLLNDKITPTIAAWMRSERKAGGDPLKIEIIDAFTFRVSFTVPYEGFPASLAILQWKGYTELVKPKHFLTQFHVKYTKLADLEPVMAKNSIPAGEWWTLFNTMDVTNWELCSLRAIGFPNCQPWFVVQESETATAYERNPYYFKVDAEGNQLPYVDKLFSQVVADVKMSQLKVIAGEVDFLREDATIDNLALYKENEAKAGFRVQLLKMHVSPTCIKLNLTYADPNWRKVVQDLRFRQALNMAINRAQIIDAIYYGFAEMPKSVPDTYDVDGANKLLDEMGMDKKDADGYRLGPDGKTFEIPFENSMDASDIGPVTEAVIEMWKKVGVKTSMKMLEGSLRGQRWNANEGQARMSWHHGPELWWGADWDYGPDSGYGRLWAMWINTAGKEGEQPPEEVTKFWDLIQQAMYKGGEDRRMATEAFQKILYDNIWIMTTAEKVAYPLIVNSKLGNVPTAGFAIAANFAGEQLYYMS